MTALPINGLYESLMDIVRNLTIRRGALRQVLRDIQVSFVECYLHPAITWSTFFQRTTEKMMFNYSPFFQLVFLLKKFSKYSKLFAKSEKQRRSLY
jgi:deoxyadenosine/deoxycytidine kinase